MYSWNLGVRGLKSGTVVAAGEVAPLTLIWSNSCECETIAKISASVMCGLNSSLNVCRKHERH